MTILHLAISTLLAYPILSLMEYMIHRHLMHRNSCAKLLQNRHLANAFRDHALIHHARCYAVFDKEKGSCAAINIRVKPLTMLIVTLPCLLAFLLDPITSLVLIVGAIANGAVWSQIHDEMHRPRGAWFSNLGAYKYLKRRHYLHHRHPDTNFNTLFIMWDWVLGTTSLETKSDRSAMEAATWPVRRQRSIADLDAKSAPSTTTIIKTTSERHPR
jgi:sterol desaturase/sphingolipid hydroxylase (fatty acid hydroxylase superfamily)